ncbi:MAG: HAD-IA family hydrolase [Pseudomonadota bacterium]
MDSLKPCRAVIFDLDGTLADTAEDMTLAIKKTLEDFGLPPHPRDVVQTMVGEGLAKLVERAFAKHGVTLDGASRKKAFARLLSHYSANPCVDSHLYPGARKMLEDLTGAGIECAVLTNKYQSIALDLLGELGVVDLFKEVHGERDGYPRKPDPKSALNLVRDLGSSPDTTLIVGDTKTDLETARAAGLRAVLVSYGYSTVPVESLGPDAVINHLHELVDGLVLPSEA